MSFIALGLFVFSFIPLIILYSLFIWSRSSSNRLRTIILGATLVHEVLLIIFPTIYSVFTEFKLEDRMFNAITSMDIFLVMIGESVFILMFAFGLVIGLPSLSKINRRIEINSSRKISTQTEKVILNILIAAGFLVYAPKLFLSVFNVENSIMDALVWYLTGVFWYMPLVACAFLITKRGEFSANPLITLIATIPIFSLIVIGITSGVRGRIVWAVSLLLLAGIFNRQRKVIAISLIISILFIPIFAVLGDKDTRGAMVSSASQSEIYSLVLEAGVKNIRNSEEMVDAFLESFSWRAQGVRNSVTLYRDYEYGGGGFNTYLGSLLAFIPRGIWPEKPMLGSLDHTEFESAMYKVMLLGYGEPGTMGPFLASAHAYWEGGWIWLVMAGLITGFFWNFVFRCCSRLPDIIAAVVIFTFGAALLIDGLLTMLLPLYSFIIRIWLSLLPLLIIYLTIRLITIASAKHAAGPEKEKLSN